MDRTDTLRNLLFAAMVVVAAMVVLPALMPKAPRPSAPNTVESAAPATEASGSPEAPVPAAAGAYTVMEAEAAQEVKVGAAPATSEGSEPSPYRLEAVLSNVGASVDSVRLSDHLQEIKKPERYQLLSPHTELNGGIKRSFAIEKVNVDGQDVPLEDKKWRAGAVEDVTGVFPGLGPQAAGQKVTFTIDLQKDAQPELRLTRTYLLPAQSIESHRHDMWSEVSIENLSANAHRVVLSYRGAVRVPGITGQFSGEYLDYGVRKEGYVVGARRTSAEVGKAPGGRLTLYRLTPDALQDRLSWAGVGNTYFTATVAPVEVDAKPSSSIAEVVAVDLDANVETPADVTLTFVTTTQELPASGRVNYIAELYLGEKDRTAFKGAEPYLSRNYYFQIAAGLPWCTVAWLVELMTSLLNGLYYVVHDFGVAIIILVLIVRALLHPITKKGQVNMVRMQQRMAEFAPKLEEIKKKYGNDKVRQQQETMKLYREHGVNPAGQLFTCLPMMLQLPIWAALFYSLSHNILMRHQPLHFTWIHDLTAQDLLIPFGSTFQIPILGWHMDGFNLLPILVAIFMYIQQKTMPKPDPSPNMTEQQRMQQDMMQKMMIITPVMMLLFFYKMPSGLNLYIMFSSLFGWLEQRHIRTHIKERQAAGTLHKSKSVAAGAVGGAGGDKPQLPAWLQRLQKAAEDAQKAQRSQRRDKPKKR